MQVLQLVALHVLYVALGFHAALARQGPGRRNPSQETPSRRARSSADLGGEHVAVNEALLTDPLLGFDGPRGFEGEADDGFAAGVESAATFAWEAQAQADSGDESQAGAPRQLMPHAFLCLLENVW